MQAGGCSGQVGAGAVGRWVQVKAGGSVSNTDPSQDCNRVPSLQKNFLQK